MSRSLSYPLGTPDGVASSAAHTMPPLMGQIGVYPASSGAPRGHFGGGIFLVQGLLPAAPEQGCGILTQSTESVVKGSMDWGASLKALQGRGVGSLAATLLGSLQRKITYNSECNPLPACNSYGGAIMTLQFENLNPSSLTPQCIKWCMCEVLDQACMLIMQS